MKPITPVIVCCDAQREKVERMVDWCECLDGTRLEVIEAEDKRTVAPHTYEAKEVALAGFHQVAWLFSGRPFIWLEVDSVPLKAGWVNALSREYYNAVRADKKHFVYAQECKSGFLVGGIGVYGPHTSWIVPESFPPFPPTNFDLWLVQHMSHTICFSPLIQHRYCAEHAISGQTLRENEFPRDRDIIRPDALIFHADKEQGLIDI